MTIGAQCNQVCRIVCTLFASWLDVMNFQVLFVPTLLATVSIVGVNLYIRSENSLNSAQSKQLKGPP